MTAKPPLRRRPGTGLAIRASLSALLLAALSLPGCGGADGRNEVSASTGSAARAVEDVDAARAEAARPLPAAPPEEEGEKKG